MDFNVEKKYQLTLDNIKKLWNILIKRAITTVESNIFLNWIIKQKESNTNETKRNYNFSIDFYKTLFINLFGDKNFMEDQQLTPNIYNCLQNLFDIVNANEDYIDFSSKSSGRRVLKFESLIGLDIFWNVLTKSQNSEVKLIFLK
jgi:hypothetical protein